MVEIMTFPCDMVSILPATALGVPELKLKEAPSEALGAAGLVRYGSWRCMHGKAASLLQASRMSWVEIWAPASLVAKYQLLV